MNIFRQSDIECTKDCSGEGVVRVEKYIGMILMVAACIIVLLIGAVRTEMEWMLNIVTRSILGTIAIYFINMTLNFWGISLGVGINALTILTSGTLGIPGLLALYGIGIYQML